jgi:hypothetical protein
MFDRATQLYRINLAVIAVVLLLSFLPLLDMDAVMTFVDRASGKVYPLYPTNAPWHVYVGRALTLKMGPHQIQILGLYACLLLVAPIAIYLLSVGKTRLLLAVSWILYFYAWISPYMITGAQFENGFPILTWQVIFFHGMAVGYHRSLVMEFFRGKYGKYAIGAAFVVAGAFFFFAQNTPNQMVPAFSRLSFIAPETYGAIYSKYCQKNSLGILRLVNYAAFLVVAFTLLTRFWRPINKLFGWFFIPMGQASLYVFIVHIFVIALMDNLIGLGLSRVHEGFILKTIGHTTALAILWMMVRYRVLYRWIPR